MITFLILLAFNSLCYGAGIWVGRWSKRREIAREQDPYFDVFCGVRDNDPRYFCVLKPGHVSPHTLRRVKTYPMQPNLARNPNR